MNRIKRWWRRPFWCKLGRHVRSEKEWSYGMHGKVDFYCARCQKWIDSLYLDDAPQHIREMVKELLSAELTAESEAE